MSRKTTRAPLLLSQDDQLTLEKLAHEGCDLTPLAKGYLRELKTDPETEDWKWSEAREALRVFARGIENWHWDGGKPCFRLRTRVGGSNSVDFGDGEPVEANGAKETTEATGEPEGLSAAGDPAPKMRAPFFEVPRDWRERVQAALRVQRYAYRTEQSSTATPPPLRKYILLLLCPSASAMPHVLRIPNPAPSHAFALIRGHSFSFAFHPFFKREFPRMIRE